MPTDTAAADGSSPKSAHSGIVGFLECLPDTIPVMPDLFRWLESSTFMILANLTHQLERGLENAPPSHRIEIAPVVWNGQKAQIEGTDETQFRAADRSS